jgi:hypothetical protein
MGANRTRDWEAVRREWLTGKFRNLRDMARRKRIPLSSLFKRSAAEGWMRLKADVDQRTEERVIEKTIEIKASRQIEILEKQLKYAQVMIGLSLNTFTGKKKLKRESDGISMLRLGIETQLKALKELRSGGDDPLPELPGQGDINVNVNIANIGGGACRDMSNDQIALRRQQLADERKRLEGLGE